jgi:hypothetical protein
VAAVEGDTLRTVDGVSRVHTLALLAIDEGTTLAEAVERRLAREQSSYEEVIAERRLWPPLDHPDPQHFTVSGTGLTHLGSAATRASMHQGEVAAPRPLDETDSMKLFRLGLLDGKPVDGSIGVQPEWFYKGNGLAVTRPGHPLRVPAFGLDAGEEPEIVGLYVIAPDGTPWRVGFALGNELSDHVTERQNYLYLAHSKLRPCSFGPELLLGELPEFTAGESRIMRGGQPLWQGRFESGEGNMSHHIRGLEHHHFKYSIFCAPGAAHAHFFGTATLSFASGVVVRAGDVFEIENRDFGKPLVNALELTENPAPAARSL